jgi:uncharacterized surface anchored protein
MLFNLAPMIENLPRNTEASTDEYDVYQVTTTLTPVFLVVAKQESNFVTTEHLIFTVQITLQSQLVLPFVDAVKREVNFKWNWHQKQLERKINS